MEVTLCYAALFYKKRQKTEIEKYKRDVIILLMKHDKGNTKND